MALLSESRAAQLSSAARVLGKTYAGTAKATWKVASFFFVLVLPLVVQVRRKSSLAALGDALPARFAPIGFGSGVGWG